LLLAAGEVCRIVFIGLEHADAFEGVLHALFPFGGGQAPIGKGEFDVFVYGEIADQVEGLKADAGAFGQIERLHRGTVELLGFAGVGVEQTKDREQRRFAAAGGARDGDTLAFFDL
jgi:hypothetical protein